MHPNPANSKERTDAVFPERASNSDATYANPLLFLDFPDPDGIRVADDYFLICSTFSHEPGIVLARSRDLVHWKHCGHALPRLMRREEFDRPRRGCGVWAPSLRHHDGRFLIFFPDPDAGIYMTHAHEFEGPWSEPVLVLAGKGLIDPCPLWDDDGRAWLVHAWAKSRAGVNNRVTLVEMRPDGTATIGDGKVIIDADALPGWHTLEGPKLYKRGGWYYVFAPAGGVEEGWQGVFRARALDGPWEARVVMDQGSTPINGPHQGAWIDTPNGEHWFLHFQDRGPFGRILHLQPMRWRDDGWPVIGSTSTPDAIKGEPVSEHTAPSAAERDTQAEWPTSDEFDGPVLGRQWQWEGAHDPAWYSLEAVPGSLRLYSQCGDNLWESPHLLTQRVVGPESMVSASVRIGGGGRFGLVVMGRDYASLELESDGATCRLVQRVCLGADEGAREEARIVGPTVSGCGARLRVDVVEGAAWRFSYSSDEGLSWKSIGEPFVGRKGVWVGARVGVFALTGASGDAGVHADFDFFRVEMR
jgi:beta-xylosidase